MATYFPFAGEEVVTSAQDRILAGHDHDRNGVKPHREDNEQNQAQNLSLLTVSPRYDLLAIESRHASQ